MSSNKPKFNPNMPYEEKPTKPKFNPRASFQEKKAATFNDQEMHPEISLNDRLKVKNFSNNTQDAVAWMKKKYPRLDIKANENGEIFAKSPIENEYRALDPAPSLKNFFSTETLKDIGDSIADVGTGALATAGGVLGAFGGPGGVIAGAATGGAAGEALRQSAGMSGMIGDGLNKEYDTGDIALNAGLSAAGPLITGFKVGGKEMINKALLPTLQKELLPKLRFALSGADDDMLPLLRAKKDQLKELANYEKLSRYLYDNQRKLSSGIVDENKALNKAYENVYSNLPDVNLPDVKKPFLDQIEKAKLAGTQGAMESAESLQQALIKDFGDVADVPVSGSRLNALMNNWREAGNKAGMQTNVKNFDNSLYNKAVSYAKNVADEASGGKIKSLDADKSFLKSLEKAVGSTDNPNTFYNTMKSLDKKAAKNSAWQNLSKNSKVDVNDISDTLRAYDFFYGNPALDGEQAAKMSGGVLRDVSKSLPLPMTETVINATRFLTKKAAPGNEALMKIGLEGYAPGIDSTWTSPLFQQLINTRNKED